jgi:hypothetical protein
MKIDLSFFIPMKKYFRKNYIKLTYHLSFHPIRWVATTVFANANRALE